MLHQRDPIKVRCKCSHGANCSAVSLSSSLLMARLPEHSSFTMSGQYLRECQPRKRECC